MENTTVNKIMTKKMKTVLTTDSMSFVRAVFKDNDFHHLPVLTEAGALVGIISKQDLAKIDRMFSLETTSKEWTMRENNFKKAKDLMTEYPVTIEPEDSILMATELMLSNKFHILPVVEYGNLVGLVSSHDLLSYHSERN